MPPSAPASPPKWALPRPRRPSYQGQLGVREDIASYLRDAGWVVMEAESGHQAVAMCRPDMPVDVLFTDIQLNDTINGWKVAEAFRAKRGNILVIYTSGNPIEPARCVAGSLYFNKPYRPADILTACQRFKI